jgi:surface polysaccharide O-acyltransferase-like enzyme
LLSRIYRYENQFNTLDGLKLIAISAMVADHLEFYILDHNEAWRTFGRLAAPLFFFVAGYVAKVGPKKVRQSAEPRFIGKLGWLLVYGLVLTGLNFMMRGGQVYLNILLVILFIKLWLARWDPVSWGGAGLTALVAALLLGNEVARGNIEYGLLGLAYAVCGRLVAGKRRRLAAALLALTVVIQFAHYLTFKKNEGLLLGTAGLLWAVMCIFRFRTIPLPGWLKNPLLAVSRYSLEIYFFHLAALKLYFIARMGT